MSCPTCGQGALAGARFCIACGGFLALRCPRCSSVPPPEARFCPGCGARVTAWAGGETPSPSSEPSPLASDPLPPSSEPPSPATDPLEDLELQQTIELIRRRERHQHERRRRGRHRRVAAAGVVAALAVLAGAVWLILGAHGARSARVAEPTSVPEAAAAPTTPVPQPLRSAGDGSAVPKSLATTETSYLGATVDQPQRGTDPAPSVERELPPPAPSPRDEVARRPVRDLPRAFDVRPPQRERPQPESASLLPSRARAGSKDREIGVEIATEPLTDGLTGYTVHLRERDGRPVTDATVSIRGQRADGALVDATLDRAAQQGTYRAVVRQVGELTDVRLRIAIVDRVQEVPLPDPPR